MFSWPFQVSISLGSSKFHSSSRNAVLSWTATANKSDLKGQFTATSHVQEDASQFQQQLLSIQSSWQFWMWGVNLCPYPCLNTKSTRWRCVVIFKPKHSLLMRKEPFSSQSRSWPFCKRERSFLAAGNRIPNRAVRSLVTILTELFSLSQCRMLSFHAERIWRRKTNNLKYKV